MKIDLNACTIRTPTGDALRQLYAFLGQCFPPDRPLFEELLRVGRTFYTWTPTTLYAGPQIVGNAALMPVKVWLGHEPVTLVGVASVATASAWRRQGVARRLLDAMLETVDAQGLPSVLFTGVPDVYRSLGFQTVTQRYLAAPAAQGSFRAGPFERQIYTSLDERQCQLLAKLYAETYPNYDGKVVRDADYWWLYATLFRFAPQARIILCLRGGTLRGYARYECDAERITLSELCAAADADDVADTLLCWTQQAALEHGAAWLTWALPPGHFVWPLLERAGVSVQPEPPDAGREAFMVRLPQRGQAAWQARLGDLQWSLADKF